MKPEFQVRGARARRLNRPARNRPILTCRGSGRDNRGSRRSEAISKGLGSPSGSIWGSGRWDSCRNKRGGGRCGSSRKGWSTSRASGGWGERGVRGSVNEAVPSGGIRTGTGELSVRYSVLINTKEQKRVLKKNEAYIKGLWGLQQVIQDAKDNVQIFKFIKSIPFYLIANTLEESAPFMLLFLT